MMPKRQFSHLAAHYPATLRLGLPLLLAQLGQIVLGFADSTMIGHYGLSELAASSFCINLFNLPIILSMGYGYGLTPLVAGAYSRCDYRTAGTLLRRGLYSNTIVGLGLTAIMGILYFYLGSLGQPAELLPLIRGYYLTLLGSLLFVSVGNALKQFTDALGRTSIGMWVMLGGNALNIAGNYLLIYGKFGLPELGLLGAGLATLASRILMAAALGLILLVGRRFRRFAVGFWRCASTPTQRAEIRRMGAYVGAQLGLETAMFSLSVVFVGWLGPVALAAHHIAITAQTLGFMTYYGMGAAASIRVSQYWGKGQIRNAARAAHSGAHIILVLALGMSTLMYLLRYPVCHLFTTDASTVALASLIMLIGIAYQPADGLQVAYSNALRSIGKPRPLALFATLGYCVVGLPLAYVLGIALGMGLVGIWIAFLLGLATSGVGYALRFYQATRMPTRSSGGPAV